jgi:hypothetical protein
MNSVARRQPEILTAQELLHLPAPRRRPGARPGTPIRGALTWRTLCRLEPRLCDLEKEIEAIDIPLGRGLLTDWYERFKPQLCQLVGWEAADLYEHDPLGESEAYDLAYYHLTDLLLKPRKPKRFSPRIADAR